MIEWQLRAEEAAYTGHIRVLRRSFALPDGTTSEWDVIAPAHMVAVIAMTPRRQFIVVRQFRAGPMRSLDELPGGYVEDGESICDAAVRELREETGYRPDCLMDAGGSWVAPDAALRVHAVLALGCQRESGPDFDGDERGEVRLMDAARFVEHARRGDFTDQAAAFRGLDLLGLLH